MVLTSAGGLDVTVAGTGGLDIDMVNSAGSINISAGQAVADAIVINASDAAGGVQIQAGSVVNVSTNTGTKTVNLGNADGLTTVNIDATTLINDSINVNTSINTGSSTGAVDIGNAAAGQISLTSGAAIVGAAVGIA